jgi:phosphatidylglycerophosphatase A
LPLAPNWRAIVRVSFMRHFFDRIGLLIATGFGAGLSPKAPGTIGSLAAIPIIGLVKLSNLGLFGEIFTLLLVCAIGLWATARAESVWKTHDDSRIVVDEIAGMFLTLIWFPFTIKNIIFGFALFRLFDIWKPGPIGYIDENAPGYWGTFFDDIVAGAFAAFFLWLVATNFS